MQCLPHGFQEPEVVVNMMISWLCKTIQFRLKLLKVVLYGGVWLLPSL